jgi:hypothetical protein
MSKLVLFVISIFTILFYDKLEEYGEEILIADISTIWHFALFHFKLHFQQKSKKRIIWLPGGRITY